MTTRPPAVEMGRPRERQGTLGQATGATPRGIIADAIGILDALDLPIIVVGSAATVARFNRGAGAMFGVSPDAGGHRRAYLAASERWRT